MTCQRHLYLSLVATFIAGFFLTTVASGQAGESGDSSADPDRMIIHEWGTFTCLQDENGEAIGGINVDDEPVPQFVHRIADFLLVRADVRADGIRFLSQGAPHCHPDVTMRLETPVVYFHPNRSAETPLRVNMEVAFPSGWLSEYYPDAEVEAPGITRRAPFGSIAADTVGRLKWTDLQVGTAAAGPETTSQVWLAPRAVKAANVTTAGGESERFLFYRGVGHVDSPLRVSRDASSQSLIITANFPAVEQSKEIEFAVPTMWLVDIRSDKSCAYRVLDGYQVPNDGQPRVIATTSATFDDAQFQANNITELCSAMRAALIADGLFPDEANALLNTWKLSYFESAGLRLFYLLPRAWTDHVLPMKVTPEAELVRTMVGRIEIVTPERRHLLGEIAAGPASNAEWLVRSVRSGSVNPPDQPADYRAYQQLGRFRNALVLDELKRRPTATLKAFIEGYGLYGYRAAE